MGSCVLGNAPAVLVALILGLAGAMKLADPNGFALAIANYGLLPRKTLLALAYGLPPLEVVTAVALLIPAYRAAAWLLSGGMFAVFALAVGSAVARGLDVSCGCFGATAKVSWVHLAANLALTTLCLWRARAELRAAAG